MLYLLIMTYHVAQEHHNNYNMPLELSDKNRQMGLEDELRIGKGDVSRKLPNTREQCADRKC